MNFGFVKIACATLKLKVAQPSFNEKEIVNAINCANEKGAKLLVLPELCVTGATCGDLFNLKSLNEKAEEALSNILNQTKDVDMAVVLGMPVSYNNRLFNCGVVILKGNIIGVVPKTDAHSENRCFTDAVDGAMIRLCNQDTIFGNFIFDLQDDISFGVEFGNDLYKINPTSNELALCGANIIVNLSAECEYATKFEYRNKLIEVQSARLNCCYALAGASIYESTTDSVFAGATTIAENGTILKQGERYLQDTNIIYADVDVQKLNSQRKKNNEFKDCKDDIVHLDCSVNLENSNYDDLYIDYNSFIPKNELECFERCKEIFKIQATALARRIEAIGSKGAVVGISGGLDSTLALLVSVEAMKILKKKNSDVLGVTMPGFGTTDRTYNNALELMKSLGVEIKEISIKDACTLHMKDIEHDLDLHDITYENTQARERTQILFDLANKHGKILVGTGDLSELAMGWCTFNGDHMCMYGVNAAIPKTLMRYIVNYVAKTYEGKTAEILYDILETPVSPELLPPDKDGKIAQKTEDNIGPYELHDFFLYNFIRFGFTKEKLAFMALKAFNGKYSEEEIEKWLNLFLKRFFISQFKRNCIPEAPKTGSVSLSPRGDWFMPSDASFSDFLN